MTAQAWWDEEWDVVVAGGGGAGLMAAYAAAERGAEVLLIEKMAGLGGATAMAVGTISAAGTQIQKTAGVQDDVETHFRDYLEFRTLGTSPEDYDLELTRLLVERSPTTLQRLIDMGISYTGPHPEPPHTVRRMHNALPDSGVYIETLERQALGAGVTIRMETTIQEMARDEDGNVSRLVTRHVRRHEFKVIRARRGVVLATGYFSANKDLAQAHGRPAELSEIEPSLESATGDGIVLATALGAATAGMDVGDKPAFRAAMPPYVRPEPVLFTEGAVLVNADGRRFTNELEAPEVATSRQPRGTAFLVFDARLAARIATAADDSPGTRDGWLRNGKLFLSTFPGVAYAYLDDFRERTDYFYESDTLAGLADQLRVPVGEFKENMGVTAEAAAGKRPDPFGKVPTGPGVAVPPFYAVGPLRPNIGSSGGLKIDREMRVIAVDGGAIPHLYAAGITAASNTLIAGHGHALSWAFTSGHIAGENAASKDPVS
ncbi:MAG: FAD-dependent oxidoreductase [SAR202 cluster bacterium]|nr:FAD-dependent oxidoreductase [SAR202 cluster bacterium]